MRPLYALGHGYGTVVTGAQRTCRWLLGELYKLGFSNDIELEAQGATVRISKTRWLDTVPDIVTCCQKSDVIVEVLLAEPADVVETGYSSSFLR